MGMLLFVLIDEPFGPVSFPKTACPSNCKQCNGNSQAPENTECITCDDQFAVNPQKTCTGDAFQHCILIKHSYLHSLGVMQYVALVSSFEL